MMGVKGTPEAKLPMAFTCQPWPKLEPPKGRSYDTLKAKLWRTSKSERPQSRSKL